MNNATRLLVQASLDNIISSMAVAVAALDEVKGDLTGEDLERLADWDSWFLYSMDELDGLKQAISLPEEEDDDSTTWGVS